MIDHNAVAPLWLVALSADYPTRDQWQSWADAVIGRCDPPDDWLISLSLAKDTQQAIDAVSSVADMNTIWSNHQLRDSGLGFFWLKYESSQIPLDRALLGAGKYAERFDTSVECERFFSLFSEMENGNEVEDVAQALFDPYRRLAENIWQRLMEYRIPPTA